MNQILENLSNAEILALTIIGEARGEPIEGQVAVGCVIRNRCLTYKKSYHDICLEPYQFSCWNETDPNRVILDELAKYLINGQHISYRQCLWVASGIENFSINDNTAGATYYLTTRFFTDNRPKWAKDARNQTTLGKQTFFSL